MSEGTGKSSAKNCAGTDAREVGEDRHGRLGARQVQAAVVVVADPDRREKPRREAHEPGVAPVVRRAGLAREHARQARRARAPSPVPRSTAPRRIELTRKTASAGSAGDSGAALRSSTVPVARHDADDRVRRHAHAAVGEDASRRRRSPSARSRRRRARPTGNPRSRDAIPAPAAAPSTVGQARHQRDAHGRDVDRQLERLARRHRAAVVAVVVARRPRSSSALLSPLDRDRRVHQDRRRRHRRIQVAPREGGEVDEGLEEAARLAVRLRHAVELRER